MLTLVVKLGSCNTFRLVYIYLYYWTLWERQCCVYQSFFLVPFPQHTGSCTSQPSWSQSGLAMWLAQANERSAEMKGPYPEKAKKSLCRILQCSSSAISDVEPHIGLAEPETEAAGNAESPRGGELPWRVTRPTGDSCSTITEPILIKTQVLFSW